MAPTRRPGSLRRVERINRRHWNHQSASYDRRHASELRRHDGLAWGFWRVPEHRLRLLGPIRGRRILELGCGAGRWGVGLVHGGARPVGVDLSEAQLARAARYQERRRTWFPLVQATAHRLPFRAASFDRILSDWGAVTFADPRWTIPEAARVLRPGGRLVFATSSPWRAALQHRRTGRIGRRLRYPYFTIRELRYPGEVNFTLPYAVWIDLFRASGLQVERLLELPAPSGRRSGYLTQEETEIGRHWPLESIWVLRRSEDSRPGEERRAPVRRQPVRRNRLGGR